ncbi:MAG: LacI family transcriptional regulator [Candidatus Gastranaerophilales bacterium]|nr:LacI family transcriptional regulator [Candidatus Gastranaerophilales bacterium]
MTLEKMARELGVSKSTVSRALSGKGRIGEETRQKIQEFARQQGNDKEQARLTATKNLGVVLPGDVYLNGGNYFQECILGVCETATFLDYNVLITTDTVNDTSGIRVLVEKGKVDGIILTRSLEDDAAIRYLIEQGFPVGLTGNCDREDVIQVDTDNEAASEELTSLLVGKGYRRFAILIDNMEYLVNKSRYRGFSRALLKNGIAPEQQKVMVGPVKMELLNAVIYELIASRVECIICGDDVICTRVMSHLQAEGYRIPRDIAVASLYNNPNLDCFSPSVTAVNVSTRQVGNEICKQMIHFLTGKEYQKKTMVDYEILMRKSTSTIV